METINECSFVADKLILPEMLKYIEDNVVSYLTKEQKWRLLLISEEILTNIVYYAYAGSNIKKPKLDIRIVVELDSVSIIFEDAGVPFDPLNTEKLEENKELPLEERKPGGLGRIFIKEFADYVSYSRQANKNILRVNLYR